MSFKKLKKNQNLGNTESIENKSDVTGHFKFLSINENHKIVSINENHKI